MHSLAIKARGETEQKRGTRVEKWRKHKENRGREKDLKIHRKQKTERWKNRGDLMKKRERENREGRQRDSEGTTERGEQNRGGKTRAEQRKKRKRIGEKNAVENKKIQKK
jgi:hypothetical protein